MDSAIHIETRRPWRQGERLMLLGPGGVGKSTLGRALAAALGWHLIDLDFEFCERIEVIGPFIATHGYERYRAENLALAELLVGDAPPATVFVTSSGFLVAAAGTDDRRRADRLVAGGYGITLLPSRDVETATSIVVARQLTRGFGFERQSEEQKFRKRFEIYREAGDMLVGSAAPPETMAAAVVGALGSSLANPAVFRQR
jgi:shikimate kinase